MRRSITINLALLSFAASSLVPTPRAQAGTQAAATAAPVAANWKINCPGVRNVLMTADAEQSLPLQVVATLKCGEEVTFLDNADGYTVQIETADGKIGYVAAMYIKNISEPGRPANVDSAASKGNRLLTRRRSKPWTSNMQPSGPTTRLPAPSGSNVAKIRSS